MKVTFTLDLPLKMMVETYAKPGFLKVKDKKNPTSKELKEAAKLYFYENSADEELFNCPIENIELNPDDFSKEVDDEED